MSSNPCENQELSWAVQPAINKIDTHHHIVPDFYSKAVGDAGGDPSGWPTPEWSVQRSETIMQRLGIKAAVISVTAPGACVLHGQASYELVHKLNDYAASLRDAQPSKFGFFANLPSLLDTQAALDEITYALDTLHADGVVVFTRYGNGNFYLGHPSIEPIWAELNRRRAVVFVHPTHPVDTHRVNGHMPQPLIDYPHETTRAAVDMISSGTRSKYPNCSVILSHAGGTLPFLMSRVVEIGQDALRITPAQAWEDFRSFHFDLALATSPHVLRMALEMIPHDHIIYGSDFPYATAPSYPRFLEDLEAFDMDADLREKINHKNAERLFPRLVQGVDGRNP